MRNESHAQVRKGGPSSPLKFLSVGLLVIFLHQIVASQITAPDLVVINARVRTMTAKNSLVEALAVTGNRITSVGTNRSIRKLVGTTTRVIDARGRLVLPGFNDAHVHFMGIGNSFSSLDLRGVSDAGEMARRVERYARFLPKGRWILGAGWNNTGWQLPGRSAIDAITPDNPVFIYEAGAKAAFANGGALKLAGLGSDSEPTGIVRGVSLERVRAVVPTAHTRNWAELGETATNYAASLGVTSVQDMHSDDSGDIYRELERAGTLKTRVYDCISLPDWKRLIKTPGRVGAEMVRGGCLKSFSDGDEESAPKLLRDVLAADKAGLQVMIHAIGNSANNIVLGAFEQVIKTNGWRDRRLRVEHADRVRVEDLPRFQRSDIIASMQPHLFAGGSGGYYLTLLKRDTMLAFGSDAAITDFNPLLGIQAAVNAGKESITIYDAVRAYTYGSAFAEFQEKEKGTIEVGKLADFVILSDDIFTIERALIRDTRIIMTIVNGRVVYERN